METLLELGADPNYMNSSGKTCMMIACYAGKEDPIKVLRDRGVSWDARDKNGLTAVHWAAEGGHDDLLLDMIRDGAPVDVECTVNGWSPLMRVACVNGNYDVGEVLISKYLRFHVTMSLLFDSLWNACKPLHEAIFRARYRYPKGTSGLI